MSLQQALDDLRHARRYARTAMDDEEQAQLNVQEATADLLEAIAERMLAQGPEALRFANTGFLGDDYR